MKYREAVEEDLPRLVEMGCNFLDASPYKTLLPKNTDQMEATLRGFVTSEHRRILVCENGKGISGMLAFMLFPHFLSGELIAGELVWWVEPEARGEGLELLKRAEELARNMGARKFQMVAPDERVGKLYERRMYRKVEVQYQKELR